MKRHIACFLILSGIAAAQTSVRVAGGAAKSARNAESSRWMEMPVLDFAITADPLEVRVIEGIPGAAEMSEPLALPEGAVRVTAAPGQGWLLVERSEMAPVLWQPGRGAAEFPGLEGRWEMAALSPSGGEAAFYRKDEKLLRVYRGLPGQPELMRSEAMAGWPENLEALALADGGEALGGRAGSGSVVWLDAAGGVALPLLETDQAGELTFLRGAKLLAAIDTARARVMMFGDPAADGEVRTLLGAGDGLSAPEKLVSRQPGVLQVGEAERIWTVGLDGGPPVKEDVPSGRRLEPMTLKGLWLLKAEAGEPAWLWFDAVTEQRVTFVTVAGKGE